jgi:hypothetical protein
MNKICENYKTCHDTICTYRFPYQEDYSYLCGMWCSGYKKGETIKIHEIYITDFQWNIFIKGCK